MQFTIFNLIQKEEEEIKYYLFYGILILYKYIILKKIRAPDSAKIKSKMLYTSSKADLRKKLVGVATEIQATDASEIDFDYVLEKASKDVK